MSYQPARILIGHMTGELVDPRQHLPRLELNIHRSTGPAKALQIRQHLLCRLFKDVLLPILMLVSKQIGSRATLFRLNPGTFIGSHIHKRLLGLAGYVRRNKL